MSSKSVCGVSIAKYRLEIVFCCEECDLFHTYDVEVPGNDDVWGIIDKVDPEQYQLGVLMCSFASSASSAFGEMYIVIICTSASSCRLVVHKIFYSIAFTNFALVALYLATMPPLRPNCVWNALIPGYAYLFNT